MSFLAVGDLVSIDGAVGEDCNTGRVVWVKKGELGVVHGFKRFSSNCIIDVLIEHGAVVSFEFWNTSVNDMVHVLSPAREAGPC